MGAFVLGENDFRKSFSSKPACLVATENKIFRKSSSCWPKFTPLTRKWIYTLIFTSIHFRKKREREREREERAQIGEHRSMSGAIDEQCDRPTSALVDQPAARSTSDAIVQRACSSIAIVDRAACRMIAPRDLIDCDRRSRCSLARCNRPTSGAIDDRCSPIWALSSLSLSLSLWSGLSLLSLSLSLFPEMNWSENKGVK